MKKTRAEKNYVSAYTFRKWVRAMHKQFVENGQAITTSINGTTYVYLRSKVGVARCNPNDVPNPQIGIAYAWARCTGQPVYYEKINTYKPIAGDLINVTFANGRTRYLTFIAEGIDNYCFRTLDGHLEVYYKDHIKDIASGK